MSPAVDTGGASASASGAAPSHVAAPEPGRDERSSRGGGRGGGGGGGRGGGRGQSSGRALGSGRESGRGRGGVIRGGRGGVSRGRVGRQRNQAEPSTAHGSYAGYYRRRGADVATRLRLLERSWVDGKRVLDVGCNDGAIVMAVARGKAGPVRRRGREREEATDSSVPVRVVGVDIDAGLVEKARKGLRLTRELDGGGGLGDVDVEFFAGDFAKENVQKRVGTGFDLVTMLSVTKWVHLYGGDVGLRRFFRGAWNCLKPGGVLVLEPQMTKSYKRARANVRKTWRQDNPADAAILAAAVAEKDATKAAADAAAKAVAEVAGNDNDNGSGSGSGGGSGSGSGNGSGSERENGIANGSGSGSVGAVIGSSTGAEPDGSKRDPDSEPVKEYSGLVEPDFVSMKPEDLKDYLVSEAGGFSHMAMLRNINEAKHQPFNRPVMAFFKRVSGPEPTFAQPHTVGVVGSKPIEEAGAPEDN